MKAYKITFKTDVQHGSMIWNFLYNYEIWYYLARITNTIENRVINWEIILNYIEEFDLIHHMIAGIRPIISELEVKLIVEEQDRLFDDDITDVDWEDDELGEVEGDIEKF